ncbi:DnaJ-class molecular chaperone [Lipingzhangella halophila]|uniref:DnaJ-class molecular chaperone n=1 Tax=Lipingzhangella halophila TaxID=1783352 RepID=A0A7W7RNI2_9ACTN|nr:DnaJ-class molecular chaperone [Lipingzhangella halophila]
MGKHGKEVECRNCHGSGQVEESQDGKIVWVTCKICHGSGKV